MRVSRHSLLLCALLLLAAESCGYRRRQEAKPTSENLAPRPELVEAEKYFQEGLRLEIDGQYDKALHAIEQSIAAVNDYYPAWLHRGRVNLVRDKALEAMMYLQVAVGLRPNDPEALYWRGEAHLRLGETFDAIADYGRALQVEKDKLARAEIYTSRAEAYARVGRGTEALEDYSNAIRWQPGAPSLHYRRGLLFRQLGQTDAAARDFAAALALRPNYEEAKLAQRSVNQASAQQPNTAPSPALAPAPGQVQTAPTASVTPVPAQQQTAVAAVTTPAAMRRQEAPAVVAAPAPMPQQGAVATSKTPGPVQQQKAPTAVATPTVPQQPAVAAARVPVSTQQKAPALVAAPVPQQPAVSAAKMPGPAQQQKAPAAITTPASAQQTTSAAAPKPVSPVHQQSAAIRPSTSAAPVSVSASRSLIVTKSVPPPPPGVPLTTTRSAEDLCNSARNLIQARREQEAITELNEALRLKPKYAEALNARGFAWLLLQRYPQAIADFDAALQINPNYPNAAHNRTVAIEAARALREKATSAPAKPAAPPIKPPATTASSTAGSAESRWQAARQLIYSGQYHDAVQQLNGAIDMRPRYAEAFNARGFAWLLLRQYQRALSDFDQALQLLPNYPNAIHNREVTLKALNKAGSSEAAYIPPVPSR